MSIVPPGLVSGPALVPQPPLIAPTPAVAPVAPPQAADLSQEQGGYTPGGDGREQAGLVYARPAPAEAAPATGPAIMTAPPAQDPDPAHAAARAAYALVVDTAAPRTPPTTTRIA